MASIFLSQPAKSERVTAGIPLESVASLCRSLEAASIRYCHWKSNNTLDQSASGDKDLDFLVARGDSLKFSAVLSKCGFKLAHPPADKRIPGVLDYFGYDTSADKWIHVHAHYQLIMGHDLSKKCRLALEEPYLESSVQRGIFKVPAPEFEFIVFVVRMMLKHSTWQAVIAGEGRLRPAERQELHDLRDQVDRIRVNGLLERHLPYLGVTLFWSCLDALAPNSSIGCRLRVGHQLEASLRAQARRGGLSEFFVKLSRQVASAVRWRTRRTPLKYRLGSGGVAIAIVGGDGAGKSTAVDGLHRWLSKYFSITCVHFGKPAWSLVTIAVRGVLKIGQLVGLYGVETAVRDTLAEESPVSPGYAWLIREVCRARDRYWTYVTARRRALNGGFVIFDRYPLAQIELMDGPLTRRFVRDLAGRPGAGQFLRPHTDNRMVRFLVQLEENYYKQIVRPELLIVLRVDPETAVQRKQDEQEREVRERSTEIWRLNWEQTGAHVIDAGKCQTDVLAELKALIWAQL
jgi:thymidylate kinase